MITAVLTGYNRPHTLQPQLSAILQQTIPMEKDRVMLWYNKGEKEQTDLRGIKTAFCNSNFKFHSRFAFALLAKTEYIAIFDDDTIPGIRWFENCLNTMKTHEGILGTAGVILGSKKYTGMSKAGWNGVQAAHPIEVDLVGHGWFFKKEWLKYMWMEEPLSWETGEDIQFSYLAQKYGGIKTYVPPHPPKDTILWGSTKGALHGNDAAATYLKTGHYSTRNACVKKAIDNGWKPIFMRND